MNINYFILLSQFLFVETIKTSQHPGTSSGQSDNSGRSICSEIHKSYSSDQVSGDLLSLSDVKITLAISPNNNEHFHLKKVNRVLANEHLPVWILEKTTNRKLAETSGGLILKPDLKVMQQFGKFSFYQDPQTSSAAVYYHNRRQFDGMIDHRYSIQGLSIDKIHPGAKTKIKLGTSGIISKPQLLADPTRNSIVNEGESTNEGAAVRRTYRNRLYDGYPEILVIVSCDLMQTLLKNVKSSDRYTPVVSHILTLFNGVDMLYSKLKKTNIKLNLAGIIIVTECDECSNFKDCNSQSFGNNKDHNTQNFDADETIHIFRTFLYNFEAVISSDSYDLVVFLTRSTFHIVRNDNVGSVAGYSAFVRSYESKEAHYVLTSVGVIHDEEHFGSYVTIAHEVAHMMSLRHDMSPYIKYGECCAHIMKPGGTWCKNCLSWSETSEETFEKFFSSVNSCPLTNKPRSLYPPGRRVLFTADEQCQCYGYKSAVKLPIFINKFCDDLLQCIDESMKIHNTVIPMEGTLCDTNKVCWNKKCLPIGDFNLSFNGNQEPLPSKMQ